MPGWRRPTPSDSTTSPLPSRRRPVRAPGRRRPPARPCAGGAAPAASPASNRGSGVRRPPRRPRWHWASGGGRAGPTPGRTRRRPSAPRRASRPAGLLHPQVALAGHLTDAAVVGHGPATSSRLPGGRGRPSRPPRPSADRSARRPCRRTTRAARRCHRPRRNRRSSPPGSSSGGVPPQVSSIRLPPLAPGSGPEAVPEPKRSPGRDGGAVRPWRGPAAGPMDQYMASAKSHPAHHHTAGSPARRMAAVRRQHLEVEVGDPGALVRR